MKGKVRNIWGLTSALFVGLVLSGCVKEVPADHESGAQIRFGASTTYSNGVGTRTEYSGEDEEGRLLGTYSSTERIDWIPEKDRIRILCGQASGATDYKLTGTTASGAESRGHVAAVTGNGLLWGANEPHYFYSSYPAPGTESVYHGTTTTAGVIELLSGNKTAKVTGTIPAAQTVKLKSGTRNYMPDMNNAYMYAMTKKSPSESGEVKLEFHPLVTTFEFRLKAMDDVISGMDLKTLTLRSTSTKLSGGFTATLNLDASTEAGKAVIATTGTLSDAVTVSFPSGTRLSETDALTVTVLTLPVTQTDLTLVLTFDDGAGGTVTRTLALKRTVSGVDTPITVDACKKIYLTNVGVPGWEYHLDEIQDIVIDGLEARDREFSFQSYKTQTSSSDIIPVAVTVEFSETGEDGTWSTKPAWISSFDITGADENKTASINSVAYGDAALPKTEDGVAIAKDEVLEHAQIIASRGTIGTVSNPRDLSCYTVGGEKRTTTIVHIDGYQSQLQNTGYPVTANCYVVDRAGWYMFPLVYGNSINAEIDRMDDGNGYYIPDIRTTARWGGNTWAWTPTSIQPGDEYYLTPFVGASGDILMPSILGNSGLTSSQVEAVVIWQDVESGKEIISEKPVVLAVSGTTALDVPYIRFKIDESNALSVTSSADLTGARQGNILIGLRATAANSAKGIAVGDMLWSWHIWVTDRDLTPKKVNAASGVIGLMPVDLGWCDDEVSSTQFYQGKSCFVRIKQVDSGGMSQIFRITRTGSETTFAFASGACTYQWGRKDPFIPASRVPGGGWRNKPAYSNAGFAIYGSDNSTLATHSLTTSQSGLQMSVRLAHRFILGNGKRWFDVKGAGSNFSNLWDANNSWNAHTATTMQNDSQIMKTVYDPCPPGFSVPRKSAFAFLSDEMDYTDIFADKVNVDATDYSRYGFSVLCSDGVDEIRFPLTAGGRGTGTGSIAYTGSMYYWTGARSRFQKENPSEPVPSVAYDMMVVFEGGRWTVRPNGSNVNFGLTVRAMEEQH